MVPGTTWVPSSILFKEKIDALNQTIKAESPDFKIVPGMGISLDPMILEILDKTRLFAIETFFLCFNRIAIAKPSNRVKANFFRYWQKGIQYFWLTLSAVNI